MEDALDPFAPKRRKLRRIAGALGTLGALGVAYTFWHRIHTRHAAADRVLEVAHEYERCLLGADGVADDRVIDTLYRRALDGATHEDDITCWTTAESAVSDVDIDVGLEHLPDEVAALARRFAFSGPVQSGIFASCLSILDTRQAFATISGGPEPRFECELPTAPVVVYPRSGTLDGELLVVDGRDGMLPRIRPDINVVDERAVGPFWAVDGDDLAFTAPTPKVHLVRWRGANRTDGPELPPEEGQVRAWRHLDGGDVGVFVGPVDDLRAQRFGADLKPLAPPQIVPSAHPMTDDVAIGPDGKITITAGETCATPRTVWPIDDAKLPAGAKPIAYDCDDAHLYVVTATAYMICDRARCTVARAFPKVDQAGVRAHAGGAEALAVVEVSSFEWMLVDLRDPRGDGKPQLTLYKPLDGAGPVSFGGRWFLVRYP